MAHKGKRFKKKIYITICGIGLGMILAVIIPFWIWILLVGGGLIFCGWHFITNKS